MGTRTLPVYPLSCLKLSRMRSLLPLFTDFRTVMIYEVGCQTSAGILIKKNAYLLVIGEEDATDFEGKWIWKLKILPKIQIFLWKCLHHTLPVKGILSDRGIEGLGGCDSCPEVRESILHVLRECPVAQRF